MTAGPASSSLRTLVAIPTVAPAISATQWSNPAHAELGRQPGPGRRWVIAEGCYLQCHEPVPLVGADPADLNSTRRVDQPPPGLGPARRQQAHAALDEQWLADRQGELEGTRRPHGMSRDPYQTLSVSMSTCSWVTSALFHFGVLMPEAMALAPWTAHTPPPCDFRSRPSACQASPCAVRTSSPRSCRGRLGGHPAGSRPQQLVTRSAFTHHAAVRSSHRGSKSMRG
jgi:hypothetical protein